MDGVSLVGADHAAASLAWFNNKRGFLQQMHSKFNTRYQHDPHFTSLVPLSIRQGMQLLGELLFSPQHDPHTFPAKIHIVRNTILDLRQIMAQDKLGVNFQNPAATVASSSATVVKTVEQMLQELRKAVENKSPSADFLDEVRQYLAAWNEGRVSVPTDKAFWAEAARDALVLFVTETSSPVLPALVNDLLELEHPSANNGDDGSIQPSDELSLEACERLLEGTPYLGICR